MIKALPPLKPLPLLKQPLVVALVGLLSGAGAQALVIGGQLSQRVTGMEAGLDRLHDRLDGLYSRDMADRDLAKIQIQIDMNQGRLARLEGRVFNAGPGGGHD